MKLNNKTKWSIDQAHSEITFRVKHLMIAYVSGNFKTFDASIYTSDKDFKTVEIDLWIDAASLSTGNKLRDEHLIGAEFLDVEKYNQITFTASTAEKPDKDDNYVLWGELTMRGISRKIELNLKHGGIIKDTFGNEKAGFTVNGTINRNDWGLTWNSVLEAGGIMVGDFVEIHCEMELINVGFKDLEMELEPIAVKKFAL